MTGNLMPEDRALQLHDFVELHVEISGGLSCGWGATLFEESSEILLRVTQRDISNPRTKLVKFDTVLAQRLMAVVWRELKRATPRSNVESRVLVDTDMYVYSMSSGTKVVTAFVDDVHDRNTCIGRLNELIRTLIRFADAAGTEKTSYLGMIDIGLTELELAYRSRSRD